LSFKVRTIQTLFSGQPGAHVPLFVDFDVLFCCKRQTVVGIILYMFGMVPWNEINWWIQTGFV